MKCRNCNSTMNKGDKFCANCGKTVNVDNSLGIISIVIGVMSFLGGFIFFPLPIIGIVLALCQKEKTSERTIGMVLNIIALVFATIACMLLISLISFGIKYGNNIVDDIKEEVVQRYDEYNDGLDGTWYAENFKIKLFDNKYDIVLNDEKSSGVFVVYDIEDSEIDETKLNEIKALVDGEVEKVYYVVMANSKNTSKEIWIKILDEDKCFVYYLDSNTSLYLSEEEYE